jgi:hypothetical protein
MRMSLDTKLGQASKELGVAVNRLRRHLVFQRVLRRLAADGEWVVKGGFVLEARLGLRARATRDLDLSSLLALDEDALLRALEAALEVDVDGDGFLFAVTGSRSHLIDAQGPGLHVSVTASLAGRTFATVSLDAVSRPEELGRAFAPMTLPPVFDNMPWSPVTVPAVDIAQHLAEKLHALAMSASHPRPSTRIKDLLDVALILEALPFDVDATSRRLYPVFRVREARDFRESFPTRPPRGAPATARWRQRSPRGPYRPTTRRLPPFGRSTPRRCGAAQTRRRLDPSPGEVAFASSACLIPTASLVRAMQSGRLDSWVRRRLAPAAATRPCGPGRRRSR